MMSRLSWRPIAVLLCFSFPFLVAFYILQQPNSLQFNHHGHLYPYFSTEISSTEKDFQLVFFMPSTCQERCVLWNQQWGPLKKLVNSINPNVQFSMIDADDHENYLVGLIDRRGVSVLGYGEEHNPQKAFMDLKKILKR